MQTQFKRVVLYAIIGLVLALAVSGVIYAQYANKKPTPAELLILGEQYLLELDYEQAIVQFLGVIEIEPMNERAYLGAAEAYIGLGQTAEAIAVLERGLAALPDSAAISAMLESLRPPEPEPEPEPVYVEPEPEPKPEAPPLPELFGPYEAVVFMSEYPVELEEQYPEAFSNYGGMIRSFSLGLRFTEPAAFEIGGESITVEITGLGISTPHGMSYDAFDGLIGQTVLVSAYLSDEVASLSERGVLLEVISEEQLLFGIVDIIESNPLGRCLEHFPNGRYDAIVGELEVVG